MTQRRKRRNRPHRCTIRLRPRGTRLVGPTSFTTRAASRPPAIRRWCRQPLCRHREVRRQAWGEGRRQAWGEGRRPRSALLPRSRHRQPLLRYMEAPRHRFSTRRRQECRSPWLQTRHWEAHSPHGKGSTSIAFASSAPLSSVVVQSVFLICSLFLFRSTSSPPPMMCCTIVCHSTRSFSSVR